MLGTSKTAIVLEREERYLSPATRIKFVPLVVERGLGSHFWDIEGQEYLDFHSMACITNTGHNHPKIVAAIQEQAGKLIHCNTGYALHEKLLELAERLAEIAPLGGAKRVAFGLSGSDANDGALKLVRAASGRTRILAFKGAYHGNTYGALSLSSVSLSMRRGFGPEVPGIHHVTFPDTYRMYGENAAIATQCLDEIRQLFATSIPPEEVAAVFLEPIQGDSGILVPPSEYVAGLKALCAQHGILIVAEEVQTGVGRTGRWFASEHLGIEPDVLIVGKALGSGMPISAIVARSELMDHWQAPGHVFCTAANPVCCAAAIATLDVVVEEGLRENAVEIGAGLARGFQELGAQYEAIGDVRGIGLMLGVDLVEDRKSRKRARNLASQVIAGCVDRGLYMTFLAGSVLRVAPPLCVTVAEADRAIAIIGEALEDAIAGRVSEARAAQVVGW